MMSHLLTLVVLHNLDGLLELGGLALLDPEGEGMLDQLGHTLYVLQHALFFASCAEQRLHRAQEPDLGEPRHRGLCGDKHKHRTRRRSAC